MMTEKMYKSVVVENKVLTDKYIKIKYKLEGHFPLSEGQYLSIQVNKTTNRYYSIFSSPDKLPFWEILVDITPGGPGTVYLKNLKTGDTVLTSTPKGSMVYENKILKNISEKTIVFAATGCGISPLSPIIERIIHCKPKAIKVFWFVRNSKDEESISKYFQWKNNVEYLPIYSINSSKNMDNFREKYYDTKNIYKSLEISNTEVFVSGNPRFVNQSLQTLIKRGMSLDNIHIEMCSLK